MSTFLKKLVAMLSIIVEYVGKAFKAIGRGLLWLAKKIAGALSNFITWARYNLSGRAQTILLAVIVALIVVGAALIFTGRGCVSCSQESNEPTEEAIEPPNVSYGANEHDLRNIQVTPDSVTSFSLVEEGNQMYAKLSESDKKAILAALDPFKKRGDDVGFLLLNLDSGSGYCYNIDTKIYGASTYKAPLAAFLCEKLIDTGNLNKTAVSKRIENAIVWSDNDSYRALKHAYDGTEQRNWLYSMGINPNDYSSTFPTYSVRDSATLWMHIWNYVNSDSNTGAWLKGLLGRTETSFIRQGAEKAGIGEANIFSKAGWCVSSNKKEDAVNDAGIVIDGNDTYLIVAFSSAADSPQTENELAELVKTLLDVRHDLDASQATWDNVEVVESSTAISTDTTEESANADMMDSENIRIEINTES